MTIAEDLDRMAASQRSKLGESTKWLKFRGVWYRWPEDRARAELSILRAQAREPHTLPAQGRCLACDAQTELTKRGTG